MSELCLWCRFRFSLRWSATAQNSIPIAVGVARPTVMRAALCSSTGSLLVVIIIIVLIHIHLPRGGLMRWGLLYAGGFFLNLSRWGSGL